MQEYRLPVIAADSGGVRVPDSRVTPSSEGVAPASIIEVGLGLVVRSSGGPARVLITRRPSDTVYAGYWEFPGGKIEPGESPEDCAAREVREEVGLVVKPVQRLAVVEHTYEHGRVRLSAWVCRESEQGGEAEPIEVADCRWCTLEEIPWDEFLPANSAIVRELAVYLAGVG